MKGDCQHTDVIYHATVKSGTEAKKYVGSTKNFKTRWYGHKASFRKEEKRHSTALAAHIWEIGRAHV